MRTISKAIVLVAKDPNGISVSQTPAAGGIQNLSITGVLASGGVATMDVARHIEITCAGDETSRTFTITGTDRYENAITEDIAGVSGTTTNGTKNFKTVTQVATDDDTAGAILVGTNDSADGPWIPLDHKNEDFNVSIFSSISVGATLTYGIDKTLSNVLADGFLEDDAVHNEDLLMTGKSAAFVGSLTVPVSAIRQAVTGYTDGTVTSQIQQSGV